MLNGYKGRFQKQELLIPPYLGYINSTNMDLSVCVHMHIYILGKDILDSNSLSFSLLSLFFLSLSLINFINDISLNLPFFDATNCQVKRGRNQLKSNSNTGNKAGASNNNSSPTPMSCPVTHTYDLAYPNLWSIVTEKNF